MIVMAHHIGWTLCPHHLLPVRLDISIGYIPQGGCVGLSKMARIADSCLNTPMMQETLTHDIADAMMNKIKPIPSGSGIVVTGEHLCMRMRGVKSNSKVTTSAMRGTFFDKAATRAEFLALVRNHS
jgi:GTP cyclohydrolase I